MALTLPTPDDLITFWGDEADVDEERAQMLIQLSADLFYLATGLTDDPKNPQLARLVKYAILDMAVYTYVTRDEISASYSPYQSERIGSYSYSKQYTKMAKSAAINEPTGVPVFDRVVAEILDELAYGGGTVVGGQHVYREYYIPLRYEANSFGRTVSDDPLLFGEYNRFGDADQDTGLYD